jgi:Fe-S-cluster containining protein
MKPDIARIDMSLLDVCTSCKGGKCCTGRTMASDEEVGIITKYSGENHFIHWQGPIHYLERGPCGYLKEGRCSVQEVKPFVCMIYPFVPRVIDGELWLYSVGECDASTKLTEEFIDNARLLARDFFSNVDVKLYEEYWNQNKLGDFDDQLLQFRVPVYGAVVEGNK